MRTVLIASIAALVLAVPPPVALAQGCPGGPPAGAPCAGGYGGGLGMMGQRGGRPLLDPASLPALKEKLAITPAQEPQWTAYAQAVSTLWDARETMRQSMGQAGAMSSADRQALRQNHYSLHLQAQKAREELANALSSDQRRQFDQLAPAAWSQMGPRRQ